MLTKFPRTKLTILAASALLFVVLWAAVAGAGWSGAGEATQAVAAPPPPPAEVTAAEPAPVVIKRIHIIHRSTNGPAAPDTPPPVVSQAPQPSAPPTQPQPVARSRGS